MGITFSGDPLASTERVLSGFHSLDYSLGDEQGNVGLPLRSLWEVYGPKSVGKTAFCLSLGGLLATAKHKNMTILDLEIQDRGTIERILSKSGFDGELHYIMNKGDERPEDTLGRFTDRMIEKNPDIAIVDSVGAYYPNATLEGDIGDRNVGQKAFEIGQLSARLIRALQLSSEKPNAILMTNHQHPTFGFMAGGNETSGGVTKKFLSHVRVELRRAFLKSKEDAKSGTTVNFGNSWLVEGRIDNNRFGYSNRRFYVFMVGGEGMHLGLSAMWDCIVAGWATMSGKKPSESTTISMDGQSFGKIGILLRDRNTEPQKFVPFINKLKEMSVTQSQDDEEEEVEEAPKKKGKKK